MSTRRKKQKNTPHHTTPSTETNSGSLSLSLSTKESEALIKALDKILSTFSYHWGKHQQAKTLRPFYQHRLSGLIKILATLKGKTPQEIIGDKFTTHHLWAMRMKLTRDWEPDEPRLVIEPQRYVVVGKSDYSGHTRKYWTEVIERVGVSSVTRWRSAEVDNWKDQDKNFSEARNAAQRLEDEAQPQG